MGFGSLELKVKATKMRNMSAIIKTAIVGHFLSSMEKNCKKDQRTALCVRYHANFHENKNHLYLLLGKTSSNKSKEAQNCVLNLDVTINNLL